MSDSRFLPAGKPGIPVLVIGAVSFVLALAADGLGVFALPQAALRSVLVAGGFDFSRDLGVRNLSGIILALLCCFGMAVMVLGTPGLWRRVMLGMSMLALTLVLVPVFGVWGVFWKPLALVLGVLWSWGSSLFYTSRHRMPCEPLLRARPQANVIPMTSGTKEEETKGKKRADGMR